MKIPFDQMILGLDKLFGINQPLDSLKDELERIDTISAYLEAAGYTWDDVLDHMMSEGNERH